ncbi:MAG: hypothetical protein EBW67_00680 [Actinobacteria bacterium]|nr:hypothetical protein [Actinomycetota bacterium]
MSETPDRFSQALKEILSGGFTRTVLSIILGFLVGALFMIGSDKAFIESLGYFFSRPELGCLTLVARVSSFRE